MWTPKGSNLWRVAGRSTGRIRLYRHPQALWLICPILIYWIGRALILADRRRIDDGPVSFALKDRISLLAVTLIAFIIIAAA
jgi:4-hydroxybenzoate polyprenyltransferase